MNTDNLTKLEIALQDAQVTIKTIKGMGFESKTFPAKAVELGSLLYIISTLAKGVLLDMMGILRTRQVLGIKD